MDWWQAASLMGTLVLSVVGAMAFGWRMVESLRRENRKAHAEIGERITQVRTDLGGEIAELREGQTGLLRELGGIRGELGEIRGELTGVTRSVDTLRQDFRAHVLGSSGAGS